MYISTKDWLAYIAKLRALNEHAAAEMQEFVRKNGFINTQALIDFGYGLSTKYGEGSAALSAAMYDAIAMLEGAQVPAAVPAKTASYQEVAKTVQGITNVSQNENMLANAIGRLVKQAGADTTLQNARRDGAYFAWVPVGDTCPFCIALASRGWQKQSYKAMRNGHAEHIHANCDCTYAVTFNGETGVQGYDPAAYEAMYYGADGGKPQDKINAMRRAQYAENKDKINAQKRAAYALRTEADK